MRPKVVVRLDCEADGLGAVWGGDAIQVAAYTRNGSSWRLLGKLTGGDALNSPDDVQIAADGTVTLVNVISRADFSIISVETHHLRRSGSTFTEQGSPETVPWDQRLADIAVTASPSSLPGGTGDLTITIRNNGGPELSALQILFDGADSSSTIAAPDGSVLPWYDAGVGYFTLLEVEPPAVGRSVTGVFHMNNAGPMSLSIVPIGAAGRTIRATANALRIL